MLSTDPIGYFILIPMLVMKKGTDSDASMTPEIEMLESIVRPIFHFPIIM